MGLVVSVLAVFWMLTCGYFGFRGNLRCFLLSIVGGIVPLGGVLSLVLGAGPGEAVFVESLLSAFLFAIASALIGHLIARVAPRRPS